VKKKAKYIRGPMLTIMGLELRIVVSGARRINKIIRGEERTVFFVQERFTVIFSTNLVVLFLCDYIIYSTSFQSPDKLS
jgi:hypothetical protein